MKRIVVLVNKDFEYAGFIEGLRDTVRVYSGTNGRDVECRFDNLIADIYCIQNLFKEGENSSNSELKYGYLMDLFKNNTFRINDCDGILSFSTSESTPINQGTDGNESKNGCVYVGNTFFLSDQKENDPTTLSNLKIGLKTTNNTEIYYEQPICDGLYEVLNFMKMNLRSAHMNSSNKVECIADKSFTGIGVVNVMDYSCYRTADEIAYKKFIDTHDCNKDLPIGIETTHGVVMKAINDIMCEMKMKAEMPSDKNIPVNFISPIVDRYLKFDDDVDGKYGKQNFICSYNGGVVTGHMLKILNENWK